MEPDLTNDPDYREGYRAALVGLPLGFVSAAFDAGWYEGKKVLEAGIEIVNSDDDD